jgi:hypothetical protein
MGLCVLLGLSLPVGMGKVQKAHDEFRESKPWIPGATNENRPQAKAKGLWGIGRNRV